MTTLTDTQRATVKAAMQAPALGCSRIGSKVAGIRKVRALLGCGLLDAKYIFEADTELCELVGEEAEPPPADAALLAKANRALVEQLNAAMEREAKLRAHAEALLLDLREGGDDGGYPCQCPCSRCSRAKCAGYRYRQDFPEET